MSDEIEIDLDDLQRRMDGAMASLKADFSSLRTGRASASILDTVMVDAYDSQMPLNQWYSKCTRAAHDNGDGLG